MPSELVIAVVPHGAVGSEVRAFVPVIDGVPLTDRIDEFEAAARMDPHGGAYGGLIPRWCRLGAIGEHYMTDRTRVPLLGCSCGEMACWPLMARIAVGPDDVIWSAFEQPYRPERDYSGFGPFFFDRRQYAAAIAAVADEWEDR